MAHISSLHLRNHSIILNNHYDLVLEFIIPLNTPNIAITLAYINHYYMVVTYYTIRYAFTSLQDEFSVNSYDFTSVSLLIMPLLNSSFNNYNSNLNNNS